MALVSASPADLSASELNALLRASDKPVLAYVWAPWCPPCKTMEPEIAKAAALLEGEAVVVKLNAVTESQALTGFNLSAVPALLLFARDGQERDRRIGAFPAQQIADWVTTEGR